MNVCMREHAMSVCTCDKWHVLSSYLRHCSWRILERGCKGAVCTSVCAEAEGEYNDSFPDCQLCHMAN